MSAETRADFPKWALVVFWVLMVLALVQLLAACGEETPAKQYQTTEFAVGAIAVQPNGIEIAPEQVERVIALVAQGLAEVMPGVFTADSFDAALTSGLTIVVTSNEDTCGPGFAGCYIPQFNEILFAHYGTMGRCLAKSSLAHELVHFFLDQATGNPDAAHSHTELFNNNDSSSLVNRVNATLMVEFNCACQ